MPGGVAESVLSDHGLVGLDGHAGDAADQAAGRVYLGGVNTDVGLEEVFPGVHRHDYLFKRGVAGALADAVDAALDLGSAGFYCGQAVGDRQAKVVVAVNAKVHAVDAAHVGLDLPEQAGKV